MNRWGKILLFFLLGTVDPLEQSTANVIFSRCDDWNHRSHSILRSTLEKQAVRIDCLRIGQRQNISRFVSRIRGGEGDDPSKDSSFADEDKALIQKLLRQQVVSSKTEKKKDKR